LIVVDDKFVIVGSANINDRSMLGDRDSEICLYIEDSVLEQLRRKRELFCLFPKSVFETRCVFNGNHYNVSRFAHSLRVSLWQEHLGLSSKDASVEDPVCSDTHELWQSRSKQNTAWFEYNFPFIPSARLKTLAACLATKGTINPAGPSSASALQGTLVDHPIEFLADEKLMFVTGAAGAAVGADVFV
jgi:phospholipase D1/2